MGFPTIAGRMPPQSEKRAAPRSAIWVKEVSHAPGEKSSTGQLTLAIILSPEAASITLGDLRSQWTMEGAALCRKLMPQTIWQAIKIGIQVQNTREYSYV
jgi:hypothetical protein